MFDNVRCGKTLRLLDFFVKSCAVEMILFHREVDLPTVVWAVLKVNGTGQKRRIPWIVMTSDATDAATRAFFHEKSFFGLEKSQASSVSIPRCLALWFGF